MYFDSSQIYIVLTDPQSLLQIILNNNKISRSWVVQIVLETVLSISLLQGLLEGLGWEKFAGVRWV